MPAWAIKGMKIAEQLHPVTADEPNLLMFDQDNCLYVGPTEEMLAKGKTKFKNVSDGRAWHRTWNQREVAA